MSGNNVKTFRQRGRRNILTGQVISDKMDKTISVLVYRLVKHSRYKKYVQKTSVFKAHDEKNQAKKGDTVSIFETRALSKTKRWKLLDVVLPGAMDDQDLDLSGLEVPEGEKKQNLSTESPNPVSEEGKEAEKGHLSQEEKKPKNFAADHAEPASDEGKETEKSHLSQEEKENPHTEREDQ